MTCRSSPSVVVVGSLSADLVARVAHRPGPGETVGDAAFELHPGRKDANQAVAAARCGASVATVGRVGEDPYGDAQRAALSGEAIDVSRIASTRGAPTRLAIVMVSAEGESSIIVAAGANGRLTPSDVDAAAPLVADATALVTQLEVPVAAVERSVELAGNGATVVVNCDPFRELPASVLAATTVLVANEVEAAALSGLPTGSLDAVFDAATRIARMGPSFAVVTTGPLGRGRPDA